jgi:hypothetical protein
VDVASGGQGPAELSTGDEPTGDTAEHTGAALEIVAFAPSKLPAAR